MAGNSARRGAIKKTGKGNPTAGSGGRRRRGLEGKGPTPKAQDREGHKAFKASKRAQKSASTRPKRTARSDSEWVAGRNAVVEALRAGMPVTTVYVAEGAERDGRLREVFRIVADRGLSMLEAPRSELDLADGPLVVVVGSEGEGLHRLVAETCDQLVSIPMVNAVESLNAGVAASVTLYAVAQARGVVA